MDRRRPASSASTRSTSTTIHDPARPADSLLLAAGIPVVEHLTGLDQLPPTGVQFTAAPPRVAGFGTFPVRAYAALPES